jgi:hypothetical protein
MQSIRNSFAVIALLIIVILTIVPTASSQSPVHQASGAAKWGGSPSSPNAGISLHFDAQIVEAGAVTGQVQFIDHYVNDPIFHGQVTCLEVQEGHIAFVGGVVTQILTPDIYDDLQNWHVGDEFIFYVEDNGGSAGLPDKANRPVDWLKTSDCHGQYNQFRLRVGAVPIQNGSLLVR